MKLFFLLVIIWILLVFSNRTPSATDHAGLTEARESTDKHHNVSVSWHFLQLKMGTGDNNVFKKQILPTSPGEAELTFLNATPAVDTPSTEQPSETMPPLTQCPVLELCSELKKADIKPPYIIQTLGYGTQPHPPMKSCNVAAQGENAKALFIKFLNLTLSGDDDLRIYNDGGSRSFNTNSNKLETIKLAGTSFSIIFNPAGKRDRQFTGFQMLVYPDHIQQTQLKYCLNRALSRLPNINNNLPKPGP